jgi:fructokinase
MIDVVSMGELLVEFVAIVPNMPLADVPGLIKASGGAPTNVAVGLQRWNSRRAASARSVTIRLA